MNTPERHSFQGGSDGHHDPVPQFRLPVPEAFLSGARVQTAPPPVPRGGVLQPLRGAGEGRSTPLHPFATPLLYSHASCNVLSPNFRVFRVTIFIIYHFSFIILPCASLSYIFFAVFIRGFEILCNFASDLGTHPHPVLQSCGYM